MQRANDDYKRLRAPRQTMNCDERASRFRKSELIERRWRAGIIKTKSRHTSHALDARCLRIENHESAKLSLSRCYQALAHTRIQLLTPLSLKSNSIHRQERDGTGVFANAPPKTRMSRRLIIRRGIAALRWRGSGSHGRSARGGEGVGVVEGGHGVRLVMGARSCAGGCCCCCGEEGRFVCVMGLL